MANGDFLVPPVIHETIYGIFHETKHPTMGVAFMETSRLTNGIRGIPQHVRKTTLSSPRGERRRQPGAVPWNHEQQWKIISMDWFKGKLAGKLPYWIGTSMVSCRFSLKPTSSSSVLGKKTYELKCHAWYIISRKSWFSHVISPVYLFTVRVCIESFVIRLDQGMSIRSHEHVSNELMHTR